MKLPFKGNRLNEGWQLAAIVQAANRQSGEHHHYEQRTVNGVANTIRPDVARGRSRLSGGCQDPLVLTSTALTAVAGSFGESRPQRVIIGPGFSTVDRLGRSRTLNSARRCALSATSRRRSSTCSITQASASPGTVVGRGAFATIH